MIPYSNIIAELSAHVPELASECESEVTTFLEECEMGVGSPLSAEDLEYLRALQSQNSDSLKDRIEPPLPYMVFEGSLVPLLAEMLADGLRHARLAEILNWLESLLI